MAPSAWTGPEIAQLVADLLDLISNRLPEHEAAVEAWLEAHRRSDAA